jgi:opacity protein-like surface antigen
MGSGTGVIAGKRINMPALQLVSECKFSIVCLAHPTIIPSRQCRNQMPALPENDHTHGTYHFTDNKMIKKFIAAAALATLASSAFAAQPNTFYAGVDGGSTKIDDFGDDKGSYGAFLGYNFHENFAAEIGARRLGKWDYFGADVHANQYSASIIGTLPLQNNFNVFGRLGYNKVTAKAEYQGYTADADDKGVLYGVGVGYQFTPTIAGRVEFQKPSSDSRNISAGVAFAF